MIRIFLIFGIQRLFVRLCAWLTLLPTSGPLPQIPHFFAISNSRWIF